jgi:hypothetical protein
VRVSSQDELTRDDTSSASIHLSFLAITAIFLRGTSVAVHWLDG